MIFLFRILNLSKKNLVRYQTKRSKSVVLLSTYKSHHVPEVQNGGEGKPSIILDYNRYKGGVDALDMMVGSYSSKQTSFRWPMRILFWLLDVAAINAFRLYSMKNPHLKIEHFRSVPNYI